MLDQCHKVVLRFVDFHSSVTSNAVLIPVLAPHSTIHMSISREAYQQELWGTHRRCLFEDLLLASTRLTAQTFSQPFIGKSMCDELLHRCLLTMRILCKEHHPSFFLPTCCYDVPVAACLHKALVLSAPDHVHPEEPGPHCFHLQRTRVALSLRALPSARCRVVSILSHVSLYYVSTTS